MYYNIYQQYYLNLLNLEGIIFAHGKFKFKLFLSDLWYEPETLWLFLTFTEGFFAEKNEKVSGGNIFLYMRYCQK